jgi:hypothetical protein
MIAFCAGSRGEIVTVQNKSTSLARQPLKSQAFSRFGLIAKEWISKCIDRQFGSS